MIDLSTTKMICLRKVADVETPKRSRSMKDKKLCCGMKMAFYFIFSEALELTQPRSN
jgi:hypothetical protein